VVGKPEINGLSDADKEADYDLPSLGLFFFNI